MPKVQLKQASLPFGHKKSRRICGLFVVVAGTGIKLPSVRENKRIKEPFKGKYNKAFRHFSKFYDFPILSLIWITFQVICTYVVPEKKVMLYLC